MSRGALFERSIIFVLAVFWLLITIFPLTMIVSTTFSTPGRDLTSAIYPNSWGRWY